jgi:hypothetical protein
MKFSLEGKEIELRGITGKPDKVIRSNGMKKLLKKGHQGATRTLDGTVAPPGPSQTSARRAQALPTPSGALYPQL